MPIDRSSTNSVSVQKACRAMWGDAIRKAGIKPEGTVR